MVQQLVKYLAGFCYSLPNAPGGIGGLLYSYSGTNTYYYHSDALGNVTLITDASGNVVQRYDYDAFGNIVTQTGSEDNDYRYKSKEYLEDSGLVYFGRRYYDPLIGRFITPDSLGMVDGPNMYLYCGNDPVNLIDAWGLCGDDWGEYFKNLWKEHGSFDFTVAGAFTGILGPGYAINASVTPGGYVTVNAGFGIGITGGVAFGPTLNFGNLGNWGIKFTGAGGKGKFGGFVEAGIGPKGCSFSLGGGYGIGAGASLTGGGTIIEGQIGKGIKRFLWWKYK